MSRLVSSAALMALLVSGSVHAAQPEVEGAEARLAAAKAALEAAQAELEAAQAEVDAAEKAALADAKASGDAPAGEKLDDKAPGWDEGWEGTVSAGVSGTDGNSETLNFRLELSLERKTERTETTFRTLYRRESADGDITANRFEAGINNDWLVPDSRWRYFARGLYEYDEFQDWDQRISGFGGVGYEFINNDKTTLIGRAGVGGSLTIGGDDDEFRPEGLLGLDFTHKFSENQSFKAGTEVLPGLDPLGEFRVNSYVGYEIVLDKESNMVLTTGVRHKYDTDPGGDAERSDLDYFITVGWKF